MWKEAKREVIESGVAQTKKTRNGAQLAQPQTWMLQISTEAHPKLRGICKFAEPSMRSTEQTLLFFCKYSSMNVKLVIGRANTNRNGKSCNLLKRHIRLFMWLAKKGNGVCNTGFSEASLL